jgi:hypothetical protein
MIEMGRTCSKYAERRSPYRVLVGKPEGRRPLEDPGVGGRVILKCIFREVGWGEGAWT